MEATIMGKRRSSSTSIAMHKQSYTVTKSKPKIRIIHIFAPEIIKTDVANFRELVQRLTGKPDDRDGSRDHQKGSKTKPKRDHRQAQDNNNNNHVLMINTEAFGLNSEMEDDEEISMTWNGNNSDGGESSGGFLNGLGDFEGFIQDLGEFPYLPLSSMDVSASSNTSSSSHFQHGGSVFSDSHYQFA